uniref:Uncharacterized protein n=1 Tax=Avena sativa TaxID=4498 RepID=A0ACD5TAU7_AVESA
MEFATGAMGTLIPKLGELLLDEYNLKDTVKKGIGDLKAELESMQGVLLKVSSVPVDQLDLQVKIWANEVRELSYAIEDSLDSFVTRVEGVEPTKPKFKHLLKMARNKFTKFKARHEIANDIEDIESQVRKIKERYDRYKIDDVVANSSTTTVDPRLSALYNKVSDLVGTDEPIDELMKILSEGAEPSQTNLKIVSIVGFGGLGKTPLAKALYDKVSKTYDYQGFVPVGQNQCTKKVLSDILFELDKELHKAAERLDERQLINQLQEVLARKRYFIVIDDLWDIPTWETIRHAFMDSHPDSRIIITTRNHDVATNAGGIYRMKPLSDDNSKMLFHTRTCGAEGVSQDNQQDEVINKILKKCAGVPLAIISIASLLVAKPSADWSKVYDAIGFGDEDSEVIQNTRKILSFSYYDLRPYLKTCLLYLGMYPEDKFIQKKSLIWRWVSERFVLDKKGIGSYEKAESYYNELVNKSLIREEIRYYDEEGCRVHDMVLDLIHTMSAEVNFITVHDRRDNHIMSSPSGQSNRVHRLALHGAKVEHNPSIKMGHVRSFNAIMCTGSGMPPLSIFKVLRVLVIEDCVLSEGISIKHLGKLTQLRYLGLVNTSVQLPEDIGRDLKFLEILDVRGGSISELPPSVGELQKLRCLLADKGTRMKGEIGKLTCLEELQLEHADKVPNFFRDVGKLTKLRVLYICLDQLEHTTAKVLAMSLLNLHKIQDLFIQREEVNEMMDLYKSELHVRVGSLEELTPSSRLHSFGLHSILITKMPSWINALSVPLLSKLMLHVEVVEPQDLQILGRLPSLITLVFLSAEKKCVSYTFGSDEFQKLKLLMTNVEITLGEGGLPMLETLIYSASAGRKDSLVPWNKSCPLLDHVECVLDCADSGRKEVKAAKAVLRKAEEAHPNAEGGLEIHMQNYNRKAAGLVDALSSILHGLDRADQRELRHMITSLETVLRDDEEPRIGGYGEQDLSGFVAKFKSLLLSDAATDQDGEPDNSNDDAKNTNTDTDTDTDEDDGDNDDEPDSENTEQEKGDNDVSTSSGMHDEGAESQP